MSTLLSSAAALRVSRDTGPSNYLFCAEVVVSRVAAGRERWPRAAPCALCARSTPTSSGATLQGSRNTGPSNYLCCSEVVVSRGAGGAGAERERGGPHICRGGYEGRVDAVDAVDGVDAGGSGEQESGIHAGMPGRDRRDDGDRRVVARDVDGGMRGRLQQEPRNRPEVAAEVAGRERRPRRRHQRILAVAVRAGHGSEPARRRRS